MSPDAWVDPLFAVVALGIVLMHVLRADHVAKLEWRLRKLQLRVQELQDDLLRRSVMRSLRSGRRRRP